MAANTSTALDPSNGGLPVSSSHIVTASVRRRVWIGDTITGLLGAGVHRRTRRRHRAPVRTIAPTVTIRNVSSDPKVRQIGLTVLVEQDVCRLDVAVHDARGVSAAERATDLLDQTCCTLQRKRALAHQHTLSGPTPKEAEHEVRTPGLTPEVVERHDVRVLESRHELGLRLEPVDERGVIRELGVHDLHRDIPTNLRLHRPMNRPERAAPDHFEQHVPTRNGRPTGSIEPTRPRRASSRSNSISASDGSRPV